ncbi:MAG: SLBB domain-containing protein [Melioribacteraceae bacterium]|nr:SLBB domain-containing protein [Melioribacteraceae bacterium]
MKVLGAIFQLILIFLSFPIFAQNTDQVLQKGIEAKLLQPISVTIGGDFIVTGTFSAAKTQRLDHLITTIFVQAQQNALNSISDLQTIKIVTKEIQSYALRDITLKRINGDVLNIDLQKFRLTGDFKYSPYLAQDDVIIFPSYDLEKNSIDITGAVNKPVKFQFVVGDKLSDAILFAGGLNPAYENITKAEISRLDKTGNIEEIILVNIQDDTELKSGDRVRILADENQKKNYKVLVLGEVKYPGYVFITKNSTTLNEVIKKTGGFKPNADLIRAEVIRNYNSIEILKKYNLSQEFLENSDQLLLPETQLRMKQQKDILEMLRLSNLTEDDTLFFNIDNQLRVLRSESLVDFTKIGDSTSSESKFIIKEGDVILVPEKFDYVYVFGQVAKTGFVKYNPGKDFKYYLEMAGGTTEQARNGDETVVIKGKERNWISEQKEKLKLEPGDYIYVPKEIPRTTWFYIARTGAVAGIVGSIATILLLIAQFGK